MKSKQKRNKTRTQQVDTYVHDVTDKSGSIRTFRGGPGGGGGGLSYLVTHSSTAYRLVCVYNCDIRAMASAADGDSPWRSPCTWLNTKLTPTCWHLSTSRRSRSESPAAASNRSRWERGRKGGGDGVRERGRRGEGRWTCMYTGVCRCNDTDPVSTATWRVSATFKCSHTEPRRVFKSTRTLIAPVHAGHARFQHQLKNWFQCLIRLF